MSPIMTIGIFAIALVLIVLMTINKHCESDLSLKKDNIDTNTIDLTVREFVAHIKSAPGPVNSAHNNWQEVPVCICCKDTQFNNLVDGDAYCRSCGVVHTGYFGYRKDIEIAGTEYEVLAYEDKSGCYDYFVNNEELFEFIEKRTCLFSGYGK